MIALSRETRLVLNAAASLAEHTGGLICTEHILYGLLAVPGTSAYRYLTALQLDADRLAMQLEKHGLRRPVSMSSRANRAIEGAGIAAEKLGYSEIRPEHLLYTLLADKGSVATGVIAQTGVDVDEFIRRIYNDMVGEQRQTAQTQNAPNADPSDDIMSVFGDQMRGFMDLIYGLAGGGTTRVNAANNTPDEQAATAEASNAKDGQTSLAKELEPFGVDLTAKAQQGKLDPVIGRGKEIERVVEILCRRTKNNPVLIGEPGVGKTAIVDGLANAIAQGKVPDVLANKIIFSLDVTSLVAGTRYRGDFEERLKKALDTIKKAGNIVLFIDEIHMILKAGDSEGGISIANIIKPLLARGELQTIGATTLDEYRKYFEEDAALERRFQPIIVEQPSVSDTIEILKGIKGNYEKHHKVEITNEAIEAAAILSDRYISDRFLPDKAIDLVDEAAAKKKIFNFTVPDEIRVLEDKIKDVELKKNEAAKHEQYDKAEKLKVERDQLVEDKEKAETEWADKRRNMKLSIGEDEIAELVSSMTGIPLKRLTQTESEKISNLEDVLKKRIIGQDEAVSAIARAIKRSRAGLQNPKRPIGSFIFLGPTGVGKTELSKALAEALFGDENLMIRVDMSEYMEKENVSKIIGSAPGYVGYDEGGQLTEKVRRKPYSVILFDEIEKAHPDIFNVLLQILEDGRLTDSHGRTVNFKNTVVIMTSNIGASEISKMTRIGFGGGGAENDYEDMKSRQMEALKRAMKPEFINRIDEIIIFRRLTKENIATIASLMLKDLAKRLDEQGVSCEFSTAAKDYLVKQGYDEEYGARPLRRTIQRLVEDRLSDMVLKGDAVGEKVYIDFNGKELTFENKNEAKSEPKTPTVKDDTTQGGKA